MELEDLIYYVVLFIVLIGGLLTKKKKPQKQTVSKPIEFMPDEEHVPVSSVIPEPSYNEIFSTEYQFESDLHIEQDELTGDSSLDDLRKKTESEKRIPHRTTERIEVINLDEDDTNKKIDFDLRSAIIYSEILKRKY